MAEKAQPSGRPSQAPYPLAMLTCDGVHTDPNSGKKTLLGCFSRVYCREFPATHGPTALYVALTDATGDVPLILRLVGADDKAPPLFEQEFVAHFDNKESTAELDVRFESIVFASPGEYRFQLFAEGHLLIQRRIFVESPEEAGHGSQHR